MGRCARSASGKDRHVPSCRGVASSCAFKPAILADFAKLPELLLSKGRGAGLGKSAPAKMKVEEEQADDPKQMSMF
ncbi:MAG: hypothetical protein U0X93_14090 [Anaerolineales bacterium]